MCQRIFASSPTPVPRINAGIVFPNRTSRRFPASQWRVVVVGGVIMTPAPEYVGENATIAGGNTNTELSESSLGWGFFVFIGDEKIALATIPGGGQRGS